MHKTTLLTLAVIAIAGAADGRLGGAAPGQSLLQGLRRSRRRRRTGRRRILPRSHEGPHCTKRRSIAPRATA